MASPRTKRRSSRPRQPVSYQEPQVRAENKAQKSARKSLAKKSNDENSDEDSPIKRARKSVKKSLLLPSNNVQVSRSAEKTPMKKNRINVIEDSPEESDDEASKNKSKVPKKGSKSAEANSPQFSPKKLRRNRAISEKGLEAIVSESSPTVAKIDKPTVSLSAKKNESRYSDINLRINLKKETVEKVKRKKKTISSDEEETENFEDTNTEVIKKPTTLFVEDEDVEGGCLYSFKTPKKRDSMAQLAQQHTPKTPRCNGTPKTPKTPRLPEALKTPTSRPSSMQFAKTPKHIRLENKKRLTKVNRFESTDEESSTHESASEESSEEESEEEDKSPPKKSVSVAARLLKTPSASMTTRRSVRNKEDFNFVLQPDDYFSSATTKGKTSNHTLDRLKNPRLPHDQLMKLLSNMKLTEEHERAVKVLNEDYKNYFDKWLTLFDQGYTVLLHGFGSKINLLQSFHKEKLAKRHVIVINGFFPSLTIKDILDSIWVDVLEQQSVGGNPHEIVNMIEKDMNDIPALHLFMIVHNLDGKMLRNDKAQSVLSRLASIKNFHMIASIDHINAPLLWNNTKLSNYNFAWFDVTSFLPYNEETAFEDSLMVQNSGALELSSMKSVFQSLTSNARGIYKLVVDYQLKNSNNPNYQGISFKDLYSSCRETFLVSSDVALRAQLTEFLDHKLAKMKRAIDGSENVIIPIKNHLLEQFLNEQN